MDREIMIDYNIYKDVLVIALRLLDSMSKGEQLSFKEMDEMRKVLEDE